MNKQVTMPIARWTHYGRWTANGLHVVNNRGEVVYSRPEAPKPYPERVRDRDL